MNLQFRLGLENSKYRPKLLGLANSKDGMNLQFRLGLANSKEGINLQFRLGLGLANSKLQEVGSLYSRGLLGFTVGNPNFLLKA